MVAEMLMSRFGKIRLGVHGGCQYGPYGEPINISASRFRYTGQILLPGTELYHYKARVYHPKLGRFLQTDPIGYKDGMNWYAYVGNDPMNLVDPEGTVGTRIKGRVSVNSSEYGVGSNLSGSRSRDWTSKERIAVTANSNSETNEHTYQISGLICMTTNTDCNESYANQVYSYVNKNDIPFTNDDMREGNHLLKPPIPFMKVDPIRHTQDSSQRVSVNIAGYGHRFHPGTVTHSVNFRNGGLYYDVVGVGSGDNPNINNLAGIVLFRPGVSTVVRGFGL